MVSSPGNQNNIQVSIACGSKNRNFLENAKWYDRKIWIILLLYFLLSCIFLLLVSRLRWMHILSTIGHCSQFFHSSKAKKAPVIVCSDVISDSDKRRPVSFLRLHDVICSLNRSYNSPWSKSEFLIFVHLCRKCRLAGTAVRRRVVAGTSTWLGGEWA